MSKYFAADGALGIIMEKIADFLILSVLYLLFSIPIVTAGASATALYTVTLRMARHEEKKTARGFWKAFRENFRQATLIHLILTAVLFLLGFYALAVSILPGNLQIVFGVLTGIFLIVWLMEAVFVFPVQARFCGGIRQTMKNAWLMAAANFPYFLLIVLISGLPIWNLLLLPALFLRMLILWILLGPGFLAWVNSRLFQKCFRRYAPEEEKQEETA